MMELTPLQQAAATSDGSTLLFGPAGSGKSTALQRRLLHLLQSGEPAYTLLVLVAEPENAPPFLERLHRSGVGPYADLKIVTYYALAQEMAALFWPLVARPAGFARPYQPPTILSYDLAQLLMWRIVTPMLNEGDFANLRLRPQQIVSQILDTLNRAALNRLSVEEAFRRQRATWAGEAEHLRHLRDAEKAAGQFRAFCLENSLLNFSLIIELFDQQIVNHSAFGQYFRERYRHLLVDNVEEQPPAGQHFITSLMTAAESAAIVYDLGGGYKRFLAADPTGARQFRQRCQNHFDFSQETSFISDERLSHLANLVNNYLHNRHEPMIRAGEAVLKLVGGRYRREMVIALAGELRRQVDAGVKPADMAIIVPYLDGALRYMLGRFLREAGLPYYFLRRRSSPREEPRVRAWLTWLALAHPHWGVQPSAYDVAEALHLSIAGLDPARAALIARHLYQADPPQLQAAEHLPARERERIGAEALALAEKLRLWLEAEGGAQPLDVFLHRLFNELLAQPPFQPEPDLAGAAVCQWLVERAGRLRRSAAAMGLQDAAQLGEAFIQGIYEGLVTADPPELGEPPDLEGIMISTIYGYLLAGRPAAIQVWLETSAASWWDIPHQPLSNAFVLTPAWPADRPWTMQEDHATRHELLGRIIRGLTARCREGVILAYSDLGRRGDRQDSPLWRALRRYHLEDFRET